MSIIDTANHNVVKYESGKTKAFEGQRLAVITYKTVKDKNNALYNVKRENKAVSLPLISDDSVSSNLVALLPHVKAMLYKAQDAIIREKLDSGNVISIATEEVSLESIVEYLDNSNESGRLTKESVASWFDESIADNLMLALAEKLGVSEVPTDAESKQIESIVTGFKDKISALAGGKTSYEPKMCESLKKCLSLAPSEDILAGKFMVRLDKMIADNSASVSLLDAL